jgi:CheY-like chemotaxis protein
MLAKLGHRVDTVGDGLAAVEAALHDSYDVVLMGLQLPGLDGLGAIRRIRAELPADSQLRIVAISSNGRAEDQTACVGAGADAFVSQPLRLAELQAVLSGPPAQAVDSRADGIRERLAELAGPVPREDATLFSLLLRQLAAEAPTSLDELDRAARQADNAAVAEHAHSLKGSAANLGGNDLALLLSTLEHRARLDQPTDPGVVERAREELVALTVSLLAVADELDRVSAPSQPTPVP